MVKNRKKVVLAGVIGYRAVDFMRACIIKEYPAVDFEFLGELPLAEDEFIKKACGAEVILSQYQPMTENIYKALPGLKAFCALGAGYNVANVPVATRYGVMVTNVPDYCTEEVSNHTVTLLLMCHRGMYKLLPWIKAGNWGYSLLQPLKRLSKCTVGLYGFGRIAQQVAVKLSCFGVTLLACDPHMESKKAAYPFVQEVSFEELVASADFISLHAPLFPENTHVFNKAVFQKMKPSAYLINTARGALIDARDLLHALMEGEIAGAALDVLESEPDGNDIERQIVQLPNVITTGHTAFYSDDSFTELTISAAQEAGRILRGELPLHCVNLQALSAL